MVEIRETFLAMLSVFTGYGAFRVGMDISNLACKKKWYWIIFIISLLAVGYIVFLKGYGTWFVLVSR